MARAIRWTPLAADDLESIAEFIARDSPRYAQLFAANVVRITERLADLPNSGRVVPEINNPMLREIIFGKYRIVYRVLPETVELLTIHHCARLFDPDEFL